MYKRISFVLAAALAAGLFGTTIPARAVWTQIPDVVGMSEAQAVSKINSTPYHTVGDISYYCSEDVDHGDVIIQDPPGGTWTDFATSVDLVVCRKTEIPYVEAMDQADAESLITAAGLAVQIAGYVYDCSMAPEGHVHMQDPGGGWVCPSTTVYLIISLGGRPVPDVVGMAQADAESAINNPDYPCVGLEIFVGPISYEYSNNVPEGHVISQAPAAGTRVCGHAGVVLTVSLGPCTVPDVVGMSDSDAESAINSADLSVGSIGYQYSDTVPAGCVIRQYPRAGTVVEPGSDVDLDVSLGPDTGGPTVEVPDVVGMSESEAKSMITSAGFTVGTISSGYSDTVPKGCVISQSPSGGTPVSEGSSVSLRISMGPEPDDGPPVPPDESCLVAHWKLDDGSGNTAIDSSGNGFDITLHNTKWGNGVFGGAVHFQGAGYGDVWDFNYRQNVITVCAWVWHDEFRLGEIERYVTVGPFVAVIRKEYDGRLQFYIGTDGNLRHLQVGNVLKKGQWQHVAGTWDGLTQRLYIDGVEIASQTPGGVLGNTSYVMISSGEEPFNGMLDDVRIYNCALSADDILRLLDTQPIDCLVAHWTLDERRGHIAHDSSGNGNNGILYGNPTWQPAGGKLDGALLFDGVHNDYVGCGTFNPSEATGQLSVCLWAKWNGLTGQYQGLIGKRDSWNANDMMWQLEANVYTGALGFFHEGSQIYHSETVLPRGEWAHVAVTFDGITRTLYLDGEPTSSDPFSFGSDTEAALVFGCCEAGGGGPFNGALDDVRIYDCPLDENQIKSLISASPAPAPPTDPLSEALDTDLSFTTGGSADWFRQTSTSFYGGDAAQSGDISDGQGSWLQTTVSGEGTVRFYWKVSSERYFDLLRFYIDGSLQERISGSVDWQWKTYMVSTSGSHLLEWRYEKDGSGSSGSDCGWVDKMEWIPTP